MLHSLTLALATSCAEPNVAGTVTKAVTPTVADAMLLDHPSETLVKITVDAKGKLTDAQVYTSSTDKQLDAAALTAVRASQFTPSIQNCRAVADTYLFRVSFPARPVVVAPSPSAPPTPDPCNHIASVTHAVTPDFPTALRDRFKSSDPLITKLLIDIAADGSVKSVHIADTSGKPEIDALALKAARASTYAPAISACKPVEGTFTYSINFSVGQ